MSVISTQTLKKLREIPVGHLPRTLTQDSAGNIWVTNQDDATLSIINGTTFEIMNTMHLPYASRPFGICADAKGTTVLVTLEATGTIIKINSHSQEIEDSLKTFPKPRGIAISGDGNAFFLSRFLSPRDHGELGRFQLNPLKQIKPISLVYDETVDSKSNGHGVPNSLSFVCISPDGQNLWVPFIKDNVKRGLYVNPSLPAPDFESTVRTGVAQIDITSDSEVISKRVDLDNRSFASAVAFSSKGEHAFVATETSNEIAIYNSLEMERISALEPQNREQERGPNVLAVLSNDSVLFIHYFLSREIGVYDISQVGGSNLLTQLALIPTVKQEILPPEVLRGKQIFYNAADPRMATDKYISCAACHFEGGSDGRIWDFTHKGEGLRRTPSLVGKTGVGNGPLHWSGNFDEVQDFEHDIRGFFGGKGFIDSSLFFSGTHNEALGDPKVGLSQSLDDLTAYIKSLNQPHLSPFRNTDGT